MTTRAMSNIVGIWRSLWLKRRFSFVRFVVLLREDHDTVLTEIFVGGLAVYQLCHAPTRFATVRHFKRHSVVLLDLPHRVRGYQSRTRGRERPLSAMRLRRRRRRRLRRRPRRPRLRAYRRRSRREVRRWAVRMDAWGRRVRMSS